MLKDLIRLIVIEKYKGCVIYQGYKVFGKNHANIKEARESIDDALKKLKNTINGDNGTIG